LPVSRSAASGIQVELPTEAVRSLSFAIDACSLNEGIEDCLHRRAGPPQGGDADVIAVLCLFDGEPVRREQRLK
jgi:hypothetical protein